MDVIVIGAGVFGLATALCLKRRGARVRVLEAGRVGTGASGGLVGALTPHGPEKWRAMKQVQFDALVGMADWIARLESETGRATGYRRTGRLAALMSPGQRVRAGQAAEAAPARWGDQGGMAIHDRVPEHWRGWLAPEACPHGVVHDTLSAHVEPRAYLAALAAALSGNINEDTPVLSVDGTQVETATGRLRADAVVVGAGWQSWGLIGATRQGRAVKGQAALLQAAVDPALPVLTGDGLYVVAHGRGRVAVGSTSEHEWVTDGPDLLLDEVIARARRLCPALAGAAVVERWAGLRPRPPGRDPVVGRVPGQGAVWLATGGYKISFGIAHLVGEALAARLLDQSGPALPDTFDPATRLA